MPILSIYSGISGSGKSTKARSTGAIVVSRDDIRVMLYGSDGQDYYTHPDLKNREDLVSKFERQAILTALNFGCNVISDNTNIEMKYVNKIAQIGYSIPGVEVERVVFDVPLHTAIERNRQRAAIGGRDVPEAAIRKQHDRFQHTKNMPLEKAFEVEEYNGTPGKPMAVLFDIDGTLAHMRDYRRPFEWHKVGLDDVDEFIAEEARIHFAAGYEVIVMSGRDEVCRPETEAWLAKHNIPYDALFMRGKNDNRKDNIIKEELFNTHVRDNYNVHMVFDDRDQVVEMWRAKGMKVAQVNPGAF